MGIAYGMEAMHSEEIIHGDLKSPNVLLDDRYMPKICDFGMARSAKDGYVPSDKVGSPAWMAPELFRSDGCTEKVDVYAFGIILWELLTEQPPFAGTDITGIQIGVAVSEKGERPEIPPGAPAPLANLIRAAWHQDPNCRPSFQDMIPLFTRGEVYFPGSERPYVEAALALFDERPDATALSADVYEKGLNSHYIQKRRRSVKAPMSSPDLVQKGPMNTSGSKECMQYAVDAQRRLMRHFSQSHVRMPMPGDADIDRTGTSEESVDSDGSVNSSGRSTSSPLSRSSDVSLLVSIDPELELLKDRNSPDFEAKFEAAASQLTLEESDLFFSVALSHFDPQLPLNLMAMMVRTFLKIMTSEPVLTAGFVKNNGHRLMPYEQPKVFDELIRILGLIARHTPKAFPACLDGLRKLLQNVHGNESKFLWLLNCCQDESVFGVYALHSEPFLESVDTAIPFLQLLYRCFVRHNVRHISPFMLAIQSSDLDIAKCAYKLVTVMDCLPQDLHMHVIASHFGNGPLSNDALSLLARLRDLPCTSNLVIRLLEIPVVPLSLAILLRVGARPEGAEVLMTHWNLVTPKRFSVTDRMRLFLVVFRHRNMREKFFAAAGIDILKDAVTNGDLLSAIVAVLRRIGGSADVVNKLQSTGFFDGLVATAFGSGNPEMMRNGLLLIDTTARMGYCESYLEVIPYLSSVLGMGQHVQAAALSAIVVMSYYKETKRTFAQFMINEVVGNMNLPPNYEVYRKEFLAKWTCRAASP
jgi:serine/threonine protein kinase